MTSRPERSAASAIRRTLFGRRERLLDDHVRARVEGRDDVVGVGEVRRRHDDAIHPVLPDGGPQIRRVESRRAPERLPAGQGGAVVEAARIAVRPGHELGDVGMVARDRVEIHLRTRARADECVSAACHDFPHLIPVVAIPRTR
ncbi:hypothetical protein GCM10025881_18210 [Pseudolysinimonas kribbensis]|uniref:Uncharacterized protein n=1 Tax=Pseudolysinimonas kribbensis TaxID=433641 RepID=A0ABQ6K862_9MICO|nr:hypothetical protein GCM10025881_18210 [Pseudolysinimonas kribbensis]